MQSTVRAKYHRAPQTGSACPKDAVSYRGWSGPASKFKCVGGVRRRFRVCFRVARLFGENNFGLSCATGLTLRFTARKQSRDWTWAPAVRSTLLPVLGGSAQCPWRKSRRTRTLRKRLKGSSNGRRKLHPERRAYRVMSTEGACEENRIIEM